MKRAFFLNRAEHMREIARRAPREARRELIGVAREYKKLAEQAEVTDTGYSTFLLTE